LIDLGSQKQFNQAYKGLEAVLQEMRLATPRTSAKNIPLADLDLSRFEVVNGIKYHRAVITLRSVGCEWTKTNGGCTMCGHWAGASIEQTPNGDVLYNQFRSMFDKVDWNKYPVVCLYNGGSIINPAEIPQEVFWQIMDCIAKTDAIKTVVLESRAEYINRDHLTRLRNVLGTRHIRIAMGLESADAGVRRLLVHKGSSLERFKRACELINEMASLRLYGLIKPPWLTEKEAIDDAVATIKLGEELGAEDIHFEPVTVQNHTLVKILWEKGLFKLPSLWSVIEILKQVAPSQVYVSPFAHVPRPIAIPQTCPKCDEQVKQAILQDYNKSHNVSVFDKLDCECKADWLKELEVMDERPLSERVMADLDCLRNVVKAR